MIQDLLDHRRVFNSGDDLHRATTEIAGLDVDLEHAFQALIQRAGQYTGTARGKDSRM